MLTSSIALVIALSVSSTDQVSEASVDPRAAAAIERSRTTRQPYTVSLRATVVADGHQFEDVATEFHDWPLHRVETRYAHVIANCASQTSIRLLIAAGTIDRDDASAADACGVGQPSGDLMALRWLGTAKRRFGMVDIIEMEDERFFRRYEITADGIIVLNDFFPKAGAKFSYKTKLLYIKRSTPNARAFQESSLAEQLRPTDRKQQ